MHILDRDGGLVGEGDGELDLLVGERPRLGPRQGDHADRYTLAQHRNAEQRAEIAETLSLAKRVVAICFDVGNMNDNALEQGASGRRMAVDHDGNAAHKLHEIFGEAIGLGAVEGAVLLPRDRTLVSVAKPCRGLDQRVQNGRQIEGRAADRLQHLGGGGVLPQRLGKVLGAFRDLPEQPHVLDRDRGLVGKGLDQSNLSGREWPHSFEVIDHHDAEQLVALEYGNSKDGSDRFGIFRSVGVIRIGLHVVNVNRSALECGASGSAMAAGSDRVLCHPLPELGRCVRDATIRNNSPSKRKMKARSASQSLTELSATVSKTGCKSNAERLMTLSTSAVAVCCASASVVSLKRRVFSIAITAWSAKVWSSAICLSLNGFTSVRRRTIAPMLSPSRSSGTVRMERWP